MTIKAALKSAETGLYALVLIVGVAGLSFLFVIPYWGNYQRFRSIQQLEPQLKFAPPDATFKSKSELRQPEFLTTAVDIEYQYKLSATSFTALRSYYNAQLLRNGWTLSPGDATPPPASSLPPSPDFSDIGLGYYRAGKHHDQVDYGVSYYDATQTLHLEIRSVAGGNS